MLYVENRPSIRRGRTGWAEWYKPVFIRRLLKAAGRIGKAYQVAGNARHNIEIGNERKVLTEQRARTLVDCVAQTAEHIDRMAREAAAEVKAANARTALIQDRLDKATRRYTRAERKIVELEHEIRKLTEQRVLFGGND